jgi:hypothetical protein
MQQQKQNVPLYQGNDRMEKESKITRNPAVGRQDTKIDSKTKFHSQHANRESKNRNQQQNNMQQQKQNKIKPNTREYGLNLDT